MSLITCPECKANISDKAIACPHCGFPNPSAHTIEPMSNNIDDGENVPEVWLDSYTAVYYYKSPCQEDLGKPANWGVIGLSNKRIVYYHYYTRPFSDMISQNEEPLYQIELNHIQSLEIRKLNFLSRVLVIKTNDGLYGFFIASNITMKSKSREWFELIINTIAENTNKKGIREGDKISFL